MKWTNEELSILKENYGNLTKVQMLNLLPNRKWQQIKQKASGLGLTKSASKPWTTEESALLNKHWRNYDAEILRNKFLPDRTAVAIRHQAKLLGLGPKISYANWSDEEIEMLRRLYPITNATKLSAIFNRPYASIEHKAGRLGITREGWVKWIDGNYGKHTYDKDYFNQVDTPNKAYILGLLYADGWNTQSSTYAVGISLRDYDGYLLEQIRRELQFTGPLRYRKDRKMVDLVIGYRHFSEQTKQLGLVPNKSLILKYPDWLRDNLHADFIRGYFDGDGHVSYTERDGHKPRLSVGFSSGSYNFLDTLAKIIATECDVKLARVYSCKGKNPACSIAWASYLDVYNIFNWIYFSVFNGSDLFLTRKFEKFIYFYKENKKG